MSLNITRRDIEEAHQFARDALNRAKGYKNSGEAVVGQLTQTLEVAAGAVAVGALSGRFGPLTIANSPVPLDLALGVAGHAMGFVGIAGRHAEHLHNFSDGVIAGYLTKLGVGFGAQMRTKAGLPVLAISGEDSYERPDIVGYQLPSNYQPQVGAAQPLTEAELMRMAQAIR